MGVLNPYSCGLRHAITLHLGRPKPPKMPPYSPDRKYSPATAVAKKCHPSAISSLSEGNFLRFLKTDRAELGFKTPAAL